jgi:hypothetical protein
MLDLKGFDFSDIHRMHQQNSVPKAGGSLNFADSAAHAMSRLDTLSAIAKLSPFLSTDSSDSVRTCSDKLIKFLRHLNGFLGLGGLVVIFQSLEFLNLNHLLLKKMLFERASTAAMMRG